MNMFRVVVTGVLLGIAGAAFLEVAKVVLDVTFAQFSHFEAQGYAIVVYGLIFIVALMLAGLAAQASATGFALYALPVTLFGSVFTVVLLVLAAYTGVLGPYEWTDGRPLWRAIALLGASLLLLAGAEVVRHEYAGVARAVAARLRGPIARLSIHPGLTLAGVGVGLLILGLTLGR